MKNNVQIVNRKAKFDYEFLDTYVSGIMLMGSEIKSIRQSKMNLHDSFCIFEAGELLLKNAHISENATAYSHEALRTRKLLLKKRELQKLEKELIKGLTIIPYRVFITDKGLAKVEIALARGKKDYDKRETIKKRDSDRELREFSI